MNLSLEAALRYVSTLTTETVRKSPNHFIRILEKIRPTPEPIQRKYEEIMLALAKEIRMLHHGDQKDKMLQQSIYYRVLRPLRYARSFSSPEVHTVMMMLENIIEPAADAEWHSPSLQDFLATLPQAVLRKLKEEGYGPWNRQQTQPQ